MVVCEYEYLAVRVPFHLVEVVSCDLSGKLNGGSSRDPGRRFAAGTQGPVTFGLGIRDSCLVILFFNIFSAIPPAYL